MKLEEGQARRRCDDRHGCSTPSYTLSSGFLDTGTSG
jgi:hypothetical protein